MTQSVHPEHCRCSRCGPRRPTRRQRWAPALAAAALTMVAVGAAAVTVVIADHVQAALLTSENF